MKIILVDDIPKDDIIEILSQLPNTYVEAFANLDKAFIYVAENHWTIDLIMVDQVFDNLVEGSTLASGLDFGRTVTKHYPYIPLVMFTANAHTVDTAIEAFKNSGYIHFFQKSSLDNKSIPDLLNKLQSDDSYIRKSVLRKSLKSEYLLEYFRNLPDGLRDDLLVSDSIREGSFTSGGNTIDFKRLFEGYVQRRGMTDLMIHSIVLELLHATEKNIVFKGDWREENSENRILLKDYETNSKYQEKRYQIEYEAINFLLNALDLIPTYEKSEGKNSLKINGRYYPTITTACKAKDQFRFRYFQQKMIGRRVVIFFSEMEADEKDPMSMHNIILLLKAGETGTFEVRTEKKFSYREYEAQKGGVRANHILNSVLGLSFSKIHPDCLRNEKSVQEECCDFKVKIDDNHILYEEQQFLQKYKEPVFQLRALLDKFAIPEEVRTICNLKNTKIRDLNKLQEILFTIRESGEKNYLTTLDAIFTQIPQKTNLVVTDFLKI